MNAQEPQSFEEVVNSEAENISAKLANLDPENAAIAKQSIDPVLWRAKRDYKIKANSQDVVLIPEPDFSYLTEFRQLRKETFNQLKSLENSLTAKQIPDLSWRNSLSPKVLYANSYKKELAELIRICDNTVKDINVETPESIAQQKLLIATKLAKLIARTIKFEDVSFEELMAPDENGKLNPFGQLILQLKIKLDRLAPTIARTATFFDRAEKKQVEPALRAAINDRDNSKVSLLAVGTWAFNLSVRNNDEFLELVTQTIPTLILDGKNELAHTLTKNGFFNPSLFKLLGAIPDMYNPQEIEKSATDSFFSRKFYGFEYRAFKLFAGSVSDRLATYFAEKLGQYDYLSINDPKIYKVLAKDSCLVTGLGAARREIDEVLRKSDRTPILLNATPLDRLKKYQLYFANHYPAYNELKSQLQQALEHKSQPNLEATTQHRDALNCSRESPQISKNSPDGR